MDVKEKAVKSSAGILIAVLLFFLSGVNLPVVDTSTDAYFKEAITKAGLAYATCRVINASVSIVKESKLQLEPAGIGVSLAVGQVLDPIDDMTERLSDVLVTAIASLGVQKLAYEICVSVVPQLLSMVIFILSLLVWVEHDRSVLFQKMAWQVVLVLIVARFCFPVSSAINGFIDTHFFADEITTAKQELAMGTVSLEKLKDFTLPEYDGIIGTIENSTTFVKQKSTAFKDVLVTTVSNMGEMIENLLTLTFLYVGIFLIQVIALPLLSFWLLMKLLKAMFQETVLGAFQKRV